MCNTNHRELILCAPLLPIIRPTFILVERLTTNFLLAKAWLLRREIFRLLLRIKNEKNNATLYGNGVKFFVLKDEKVKIYGKSGATVSVFAFGTVAEGVYIRGLKYEAHGVDLDPARPLGVSNSFVSSGEGEIEVRHGALLVANYF